MMCSLARTLAKGSFDESQVLTAYRSWRDSHPLDMGRTTALGLSGRPDSQSQANGSLMRISPLGIFGAQQPAEAVAWARADSRLTHPNPVCQDACAAFVAAIAEAISSGAGPQACYEAARREASQPGFSPSVRECLDRAAVTAPDDFMTHQGWVLIALQNAFYQLLHADSLVAGLSGTAMHGGDTDTNAAIAGTYSELSTAAAQFRILGDMRCSLAALFPARQPRTQGRWISGRSMHLSWLSDYLWLVRQRLNKRN